jgi:hypothetical protein
VSFSNLKVVKKKPTKFTKIMPHLNFQKNAFGTKKNWKKKEKLELIWTYENMVIF